VKFRGQALEKYPVCKKNSPTKKKKEKEKNRASAQVRRKKITSTAKMGRFQTKHPRWAKIVDKKTYHK